MKIGLTHNNDALQEALEQGGHEVVLVPPQFDDDEALYHLRRPCMDAKVDMIIMVPLFNGMNCYHRDVNGWRSTGTRRIRRFAVGLLDENTQGNCHRGCALRKGECNALIVSDPEQAKEEALRYRTIFWQPGQALDFRAVFDGSYMAGKNNKPFNNLGERT